MQVPHDSYVLVADGAKMLFFRNEGDAAHINLEVVAAEQQADERDRDLKTDLAGRKPRGPGGNASTAGETDYHQQAEDRFAAEAAERINRDALAGRFEQLFIVAPPRTLGELRRHYHKATEALICAEIPKDLVGHTVDRIEQALQNYEK